MNFINRFFLRLMPPDPASINRPGAFGFYFDDNPDLWWMLQGAFESHDAIDNRIRAGLTSFTHAENDNKFVESVAKAIDLQLPELTGAQKRWAIEVMKDSREIIRLVRTLRGEK